MTIVGVRDTNFKARDGRQIEGVTLYVLSAFESEKYTCVGSVAEKVFLPERLASQLVLILGENFAEWLGHKIEFAYNKYGSIVSFAVDGQ